MPRQKFPYVPNSLLSPEVSQAELIGRKYQKAKTAFPIKQNISTLLRLARFTLSVHNDLIGSQLNSSAAPFE